MLHLNNLEWILLVIAVFGWLLAILFGFSSHTAWSKLERIELKAMTTYAEYDRNLTEMIFVPNKAQLIEAWRSDNRRLIDFWDYNQPSLFDAHVDEALKLGNSR